MLSSASRPARSDRAIILCTDDTTAGLAAFVAQRMRAMEPEPRPDICIATFSDTVTVADPDIRLLRFSASDFAVFTARNLPLTTYLKLGLPLALAGDYARIVYVDCDTLPRLTPLSRIVDEAPVGAPVSAVLDCMQWSDETPPRILQYWDEIGLGDRKYLNAGVLVFDTRACADTNLFQKCQTAAALFSDKLLHNDQSVLNMVLCGDWAALDLKWNWQMTELPARTVAKIQPHLLHFVSDTKPFLDDPLLSTRSWRRAYLHHFGTLPHFPAPARRSGRTVRHPFLPPGQPRTPVGVLRAFNPFNFTSIYQVAAVQSFAKRTLVVQNAIRNGTKLWPPAALYAGEKDSA